MLPDFPKLKKDIHRFFLLRQFDEARNSDPLLSRIRHYLQHEGDGGSYETMDGYKKDKNYQLFEANYQITVDDIINSDFEVILKKFYEMGLEATSQIARHSFKEIGKAVDEVGNSINANGPITKELFLETIKKIQIDFDEETGEAKMPTMYIHPSQADSVRKMIQDAESDPQNKMKFDKIMIQKKEEYIDREANRKLVD